MKSINPSREAKTAVYLQVTCSILLSYCVVSSRSLFPFQYRTLVISSSHHLIHYWSRLACGMDSSQDYEVHLGFWTNWSYGKVRGGTITVTQSNGSLLIAFIALFVATAGKSLWRLLCFALHSIWSQPSIPQDGWYHQRQAILRNSETALYGFWQLLCSMIAWKKG